MSEQAKGPAAGPRPGRSALGALTAEVLGTYVLVFLGVGTLVALREPAGGLVEAPALTNLAVGLAFGFAVMIVVYVFGHISGAHINPTVTIGLAAVGKFPWRSVPGYLAAQFAGAILASLTHWLMFGSAATSSELLLGTTVVGARGTGVAFFTEVVLGFLLVVVVMATVLDERAIPAGAGLAIGFIIGVGVVVTFNVSGGSFNAARTLGPMIVSGQFPDVWVYLLGPTLGGVLGAAAFEYLVRHGAPPS